MTKKIYLDNAATTAVDGEVYDAMKPFFFEKYGNASSLHSLGQQAAEALAKARSQAAKLINADEKEIIFNSGGTESDNHVLKQVLLDQKEKGNHLVTSKIEHPAIIKTAEYLKKIGFEVTYVDVDSKGLVNPDDVKKAITEKTVLVSIMHANNEIGTIQPIEDISKICKEKNVLFHTDAVQSFGKIPLDVKALGVDFLSASSHKIHGPKGVGLLYVKKGVTIGPMIHGGGHEFKKRAGTENVAGIVGFGRACEIAKRDMDKNYTQMKELRDTLISALTKEIPKSHLNGDWEKRLPHNVHVRFDFVEGEALLMHLDMKGIEVSTGSACSTQSLKASHVLLALGLKPVEAHGSLRITLSKYSTKEEIDYVIKEIKPIIENLRSISPLNEQNINEEYPDEDHDHGEEGD